jgi:hypothetical protein
MTFKEKLHALENQRQNVRDLEAKFNADRQVALLALPKHYGYSNLTDFIQALQVACGVKKTRKSKTTAKVVATVSLGQGLAKSNPTETPKTVQVNTTGTSLEDPVNFGLLPDTKLLDMDLVNNPAQRQNLKEALLLANRILHTSKIPASIWREWRQFELRGAEKLRQ